jgi:hypothetical protein
MKMMLALLLSASLLVLAATGDSAITRDMIVPMEKRIDQRMETLFDEPFLLLGFCRGLYLEKYGVVFSAELQLLSTPGVGTFGFTTPTKELSASLRKRKLERLPILRDAMKGMVVQAANNLEKLPADERVVLGISLFRRSWEDTTGIPSQIVMQGSKRDLQAARTVAAIDAAIRVQEF